MKITYVYIAVAVLVVGGIAFAKMNMEQQENSPAAVTKMDAFAQCLTDAGAKFYGAYWCPHCQNQKRLLENSKKLPYVECSTPNGQAQTPVCIDAKITGYPTWDFADGSRLDGEQTLETLAEKTNCSLPESV